jgi:hypothetical protein
MANGKNHNGKARPLSKADIDRKRKHNQADSCYFYVPANTKGLRFIEGIRQHMNRACFDLKVRRRGLDADNYGGVLEHNVTHYGVYLYHTPSQNAQKLEQRQREYQSANLTAAIQHRSCAATLINARDEARKEGYCEGIEQGHYEELRRHYKLVAAFGVYAMFRYWLACRREQRKAASL